MHTRNTTHSQGSIALVQYTLEALTTCDISLYAWKLIYSITRMEMVVKYVPFQAYDFHTHSTKSIDAFDTLYQLLFCTLGSQPTCMLTDAR